MKQQGVETAVHIPKAESRRPRPKAASRLKDLLLTPKARTDDLTPPRTAERLRTPPSLE